MKKLFLALLLACGLSAPALAQPSASPASLAAAREVMAASKVRETFDVTLARMLDTQLDETPEMRAFEQVLRDFFARYMKWEDLEPEFAQMYAETYTEAELRELAAFYRTPLGQRLVATGPDLVVRSARLSENRVQKHMPELFSALMEHATRAPAAPASATAPRP